jgi:hypothetical protein
VKTRTLVYDYVRGRAARSLRVLKRATGFEVGGNAGGAEGVAPELGASPEFDVFDVSRVEIDGNFTRSSNAC